MKRLVTAILALGAITQLTGCGSMSVFGGGSEYSCKAPDGVLCESVSGVYANSMAGNLPAQHAAAKTVSAKTDGKDTGLTVADTADLTWNAGKDGYPVVAPSSGIPLRTPTRMLRIWIAPWIDSDQDMRDQSYAYLMVDTGRWVIDQNQKRIEDQYAPQGAR